MWPNCAWHVYRISKGRCVCVGGFNTEEEAKRELRRLRETDTYSYYTM